MGIHLLFPSFSTLYFTFFVEVYTRVLWKLAIIQIARRKRRRKGDRRTVYRSTHPLAKKVLSAAFPKRRELREVRNGNRLLCFRGTVENSRPPGLVCVFEIVKFELYTTL